MLFRKVISLTAMLKIMYRTLQKLYLRGCVSEQDKLSWRKQ